MVATRVTRTVKFLSGISVCDHIVTPEWVEQSGRGVGFVEEGAFALCDQNTEQMFGMNLTTSLARAKEKKLLKVRSEVKVHCQRLNYEACDDTLGYLWESSPFLSPSFLLPFLPSHPTFPLFYHSFLPVSSSHRGSVSTPPLMSNLPTTHSRKSLSVQEERSVRTASYPNSLGTWLTVSHSHYSSVTFKHCS